MKVINVKTDIMQDGFDGVITVVGQFEDDGTINRVCVANLYDDECLKLAAQFLDIARTLATGIAFPVTQEVYEAAVKGGD